MQTLSQQAFPVHKAKQPIPKRGRNVNIRQKNITSRTTPNIVTSPMPRAVTYSQQLPEAK